MTIKLGTIATAIAAAALLAAGWFFLAPTQLGGSTSYVQVYGTSMHPRFQAGDLVLVRNSSSYHVGEIVAYRDAQLGGHVVLHRIIGAANGRYTFKGDNNGFVDSYHPTRSELVGRMWLHVPAAGRYLAWLRGSRLLLTAGVVALLALLGTGTGIGSPRRRGSGTPGAAARAPLGTVPIVAGVLALGFAGLAAVSWTRPLTTTAARQGLYTQTGRFGYDAVVPDGARVYGGTSVKTGQPLFMKLVRSARFHFDYAFDSTAAHEVSGTIALDAVVTGPNGWKRTLHVAAPQRFRGDRATAAGVMAFRPLLDLLKQIDSLSNVNGGTYSVALTPRVELRGAVAGTKLDQSFAPRLELLLDPNQLQLQPGSATGPSAAAALTQTASGSGAVATPNSVALLKLSLPVELARRISLYGGAAALLALLGALLLAFLGRGAGEPEAIRRAYRDLIVDVDSFPAGATAAAVTASSFDGLVRVAEQSGHVIMHVRRDDVHTYLVEDGGVRYVYGSAPSGELPRKRVLQLANEA